MKHYFFIVLSLLIWSSYSIILKKININPVVFSFLTTSIGWIFIFMFIKFKKIPLKISNRKKIFILFITVLFLINSITFFYAYQLTSVSNAIFSHYLAPVFVSVLAPFFIKERIERITIYSLIIAMIGTYFIFFPSGFKIVLSNKDLLGIFLGIVSALCYGMLIIAAKYLIKELPYILLMFYQGLFTFFFALISLPFLKDLYNLNLYSSMIVLFVGFTHSFIAPILYLKGLHNVKAQFAGLLGYTEILGSIMLGIIFLGEIPSLATLLGGLLIVFSGGIVITHGK